MYKDTHKEISSNVVDEDDDQGDETANETACERETARCGGATLVVLGGVLALTWAVHALPFASIDDAPPFARSLLWMSVAHHTESWHAWRDARTPPPAPPFFL